MARWGTRNRAAGGRPDRIALIHAIYAVAWVGVAAPDLPVQVSVPLLVAAAALCALSFVKLRRRPHARPAGAPRVGSQIVTINIATGVAAALVVTGCRLLGADRWTVPSVLLVLAVHFLPLAQLLNRPSLLWMCIALIVAAAAGPATGIETLAPLLSAGVFAANSARLVFVGD